MTKRDDEILASIGMTADEVDDIAEACEQGDYGMWDSSKVSFESPLYEEVGTISVRLPKSRIAVLRQKSEEIGISRSEFVRRAIDHELLAVD